MTTELVEVHWDDANSSLEHLTKKQVLEEMTIAPTITVGHLIEETTKHVIVCATKFEETPNDKEMFAGCWTIPKGMVTRIRYLDRAIQ